MSSSKTNLARVTIPVHVRVEPMDQYPDKINWQGNIIFTRKKGSRKVRISVEPLRSQKETTRDLFAVIERIELANDPGSTSLGPFRPNYYNTIHVGLTCFEIELFKFASFTDFIEACYEAFSYNSEGFVLNWPHEFMDWQPETPRFESLLSNGLTLEEDIVARHKEEGSPV